MAKFDFSKHWAQQIMRVDTRNGEFICALVRKRYDDSDVEMEGGGEWIGLQKVEVHPKITDTDPDSETFGKRINKPNSDPIETRWKTVEPWDEKNISEYKKLVGITPLGSTELLIKFQEKLYSAKTPEDFWDAELTDLKERYLSKKQVVVVKNGEGNNKSNGRKAEKTG